MSVRRVTRGAGKRIPIGVDKCSDKYFDSIFKDKPLIGKLGNWYSNNALGSADDYYSWMTFHDDYSEGPEETPMIVW